MSPGCARRFDIQRLSICGPLRRQMTLQKSYNRGETVVGRILKLYWSAHKRARRRDYLRKVKAVGDRAANQPLRIGLHL